MRPRPTTPSVLSASSTPSQRLRSQRPATSAAWACGTLRAEASSSAIVCSAAEMMLLCGALTTITPRRVAASTSTLSRPMPARPTTIRSDPAASTSSVTLVAERMIRALRADDHLEQIVGGQVEPDVDVVPGGTEAVEASVGDFFGDQDASHRSSCLSSPTAAVPRAFDEPFTAIVGRVSLPSVRCHSRLRQDSARTAHHNPDANAGRWARGSRSNGGSSCAGCRTSSSATPTRRSTVPGTGPCRCWSIAYLLLGFNALDLANWTLAAEPARRAVRRRRARRHLGGVEPAPPPAAVRPAAADRHAAN